MNTEGFGSFLSGMSEKAARTKQPRQPREWRYYITFNAAGNIFGAIDVTMDFPISDFATVQAATARIHQQHPRLREVVVLGWQRYEDPA